MPAFPQLPLCSSASYCVYSVAYRNARVQTRFAVAHLYTRVESEREGRGLLPGLSWVPVGIGSISCAMWQAQTDTGGQMRCQEAAHDPERKQVYGILV